MNEIINLESFHDLKKLIPRISNLTGKKVGYLEIIKPLYFNTHNRFVYWQVLCNACKRSRPMPSNLINSFSSRGVNATCGCQKSIYLPDTIREVSVEEYLCQKVASLKGECVKISNRKGFTDRICLVPMGKVFFIETKRPGEKPTRIQKARIKKLLSLGMDARIIDSKKQVDEFYNAIKSSSL